MRVAMATEYFWPYDFGGSEWSTYYLAKKLQKAGHKIIIVTPSYGKQPPKEKEELQVVRFPFFKKIRNKKTLTPFWHTNIFWILTTTYYLIKICRRNRIEILHLQGKYFAPAGFFVKHLLGIPVIITARDYQLVCNYGFCLWSKNTSCDIREYFFKDFKMYIDSYIFQKNPISYLVNFVYALRGRAVRNMYKYFATKLNKVVCISKAEAEIYKNNGFKNVSVIYNPMDFKSNHSKTKNKIVYAGRLTPGKGIDLLIKAFEKVILEYPKLKLEVYGEGFLKNYLKTHVPKSIIKNVVLKGHISHQDLLKQLSNSLVAIMPSVWPEPFGRVALEAISQGTPAVVTKVGGLPEIVDNGITGYICSPTPDDLSKSIKEALAENDSLRKKIKLAQPLLRQKFEIENTNQYIEMYKSLI